MDQFKQLLEEKCKLHPSYNSEFLSLQESSPGEKLCLYCIQEKDISMRNVLSIKELLKSSKDTILISYPPLNDKNLNLSLSNLLEANSQSKIIDQIETFFNELREQTLLVIDQKMIQTKLEAIKILDFQQNSFKIYQEIANVENLKKIILEENKQQLIQNIKQKIKDKNKHTQAIQNLVDKLKQMQSFSLLEKAKLERESIVKAIEDIQLFKYPDTSAQISIINKINFLGSKYEDSAKNLKITRLDHNSIQITNIGNSNASIIHGYFDFILDPMTNYIMRAHIQQNSGFEDPWFYFGIQPEDKKDEWLWNFKIGYCETDGYAISQIVKGDKLQSGQVSNVNKILEIRIQLKNKIFKVANYPAYSSVMKLRDENVIDLQQKYRFIIGMSQPKDVIIIEDFYKANQFDEKMN